ncbi:hypothetical protein J1G42_06735 [Cellulomonas sp. zg-ZUI222]|uniref:Alternate-type signal peptide domain-containing protein n=1 Tax=Cellulomonas wangleii TaxID=2816956 RepID=A0ABX8D1U9_9CELL|nr:MULTISPECIES: hypothetical protein [Cellulomonas]MBO0899655.1 hypothetical protein [Cellulomonas sp. zg-ZUI22]MBO0920517.1 hypothetical protein [Cellulomonas wangleii]MBO0923065.1 hypothetical protein [Cellulomonas wangleii]QVI61449.1 hypothetical protein KG103_13305 [Cellulomonas wangleii]
MSRRRLAAAAVAAVLTASVMSSATYALWSTDAEASIGVLRSGDLDLELVGDLRWAETSPGLGGHAVASGADGTAGHLAVPGDSFTVTQRFRTTLEGDNLHARLTVSWLPTGHVPAGVEGTYVVTPPSGAPSAPTPLGTPLTLPAGAGESLPLGTGEWTLVATLVWNGVDRVVAPSTLTGQPATSVGGTIQVDLRQVRGDGLAP